MQLLACCMITPVAFAMLRMLALYAKWEGRLATQLATAAPERLGWALFLAPFTATLREGVEAVVFITGVSQASPQALPLPGVLGLLLGVIFAYAVFFSSRPMDIRPFMCAQSEREHPARRLPAAYA